MGRASSYDYASAFLTPRIGSAARCGLELAAWLRRRCVRVWQPNHESSRQRRRRRRCAVVSAETTRADALREGAWRPGEGVVSDRGGPAASTFVTRSSDQRPLSASVGARDDESGSRLRLQLGLASRQSRDSRRQPRNRRPVGPVRPSDRSPKRSSSAASLCRLRSSVPTTATHRCSDGGRSPPDCRIRPTGDRPLVAALSFDEQPPHMPRPCFLATSE